MGLPDEGERKNTKENKEMKRFYVVRFNGKKFMFRANPVGKQQAETFAQEHKRKVFYWGYCNRSMCDWSFVFVD